MNTSEVIIGPSDIATKVRVMGMLAGDYAHAAVYFCGLYVLSRRGDDWDSAVTADVQLAFMGDHDYDIIDCYQADGGGRVVRMIRLGETEPQYQAGARWTAWFRYANQKAD